MAGRLLGFTICLTHKDGAMPLSVLLKDTSKLTGLLSLITPFVLSAKQGSCDHHLLTLELPERSF